MLVSNKAGKMADLVDFKLGELVIQSPFRVPVKTIHGIVSKEQVVRSYARRIIAAMKDEFSFGNLTEMQVPREAMRQGFLAVVSSESSISIVICESGPNPATIGFLDSGPKTLQKWDFSGKTFLRHFGLLLSSLCSGWATAITVAFPNPTCCGPTIKPLAA